MGIEQAIKRKQRDIDSSDFIDEQVDYVDLKIEELKQAVREEVIKESSKDQNILLEKNRIRTAVWKALEHIETTSFQDLLLTTDERRALTEEIMQQLIG